MFNLDRYDFSVSQTFFDYEFESVGAKGVIKKVARFSLMQNSLYNFGFGDLDPLTGQISDTVVSNNGDGDKVLGTVAQIIYYFTGVYQGAAVFIQGTSPTRTRRYQMGISKYWGVINSVFEIEGVTNGKWEPFRHGVNYEAFIGGRKTPFFMSIDK